MLPNWKNWREFFLCITQAGVGKPALVVFFVPLDHSWRKNSALNVKVFDPFKLFLYLCRR